MEEKLIKHYCDHQILMNRISTKTELDLILYMVKVILNSNINLVEDDHLNSLDLRNDTYTGGRTGMY